jgi:allantoinase
MWVQILADRIDTLGSDHSPSPPELKISEDFFEVWGGISGCQHAFPLALAEWYDRSGMDRFPRFAAMTASNVADRFGIGRAKGRIAEGFDADIALVDLQGSLTIDAEHLFYRHAISPYIGSELRAIVKGTWVRGRAVYRDERFLDQARGRLLTPDQSAPVKTP